MVSLVCVPVRRQRMAAGRTLRVALVMRFTRMSSLRSSWWLPLPFEKISTPLWARWMCGLPR